MKKESTSKFVAETNWPGSALGGMARLRFVVGYLGEAAQHNWWQSNFFSTSSSSFLDPVFAKTPMLARYHGVKEAARRVHDDHIGVGRVFHLFRLPESTEQALFEMLQDPAMMGLVGKDLESPETAADALHEIAGSAGNLHEGPVQIGVVADLDGAHWLSHAARCYQAAFRAGSRSFPYLAGEV